MSRTGASGGGGGSSAATEIGYDQITSPVSVVSTTESSGTTIISAAAHTFDGAAVMAHFFAPEIRLPGISAVDNFIVVSLFESTTQIGRLCVVELNENGSLTVQAGSPANGWLRFTPSAGSHTYTVTAFANNATGGSIVAGSPGTGAYGPAFLRFTKV